LVEEKVIVQMIPLWLATFLFFFRRRASSNIYIGKSPQHIGNEQNHLHLLQLILSFQVIGLDCSNAIRCSAKVSHKFPFC